MNNTDCRPRGRLHLCVRAGGVLIAERRTRNIVLRQGASIIANLFAGQAGAFAINNVQVGFAQDGATAETTALVPPDDTTIPASALISAIAPTDFSIVTDKPNSVQVLIASVFRPTQELINVTEAGLLAGDKLYNQVVFEPVTLRPGQDVTLFWEIDFPFGH
ncbi:MAG: hypothetical protein JWM78_2117 [Verrucomicrobiaceae bacterium]|nr:hypothetical protein [Verrucomicrobiaceae bacterium]